MEHNETPMQSNVAVAVRADSVTQPTGFEQDVTIDENSIDVSEAKTSREEPEKEENTADHVLTSAKEEGFEEALRHLAEGDFDEEAKEDVEDIKVEETIKSEEELELVKDDEKPTEEKVRDPEREFLEGRVKQLETQIGNLQERNQQLFERVKTLESNQTVALQTLLEMAMIMHEMVKDEEDEEKKVSMLEILVNAMAELMKAMFVPEDEKETQKAAGSLEKHTETVRPKKRSMDEIMQSLREKGVIRPSSQMQASQQKMAQAA